tara:strand:- start:20442 stop:21104 length:663 start_codon:yes stop_codon:yes gene_type:complete
MPTTSNLSLTLPDPGSESSRGTWGTTLNTAITAIDAALADASSSATGRMSSSDKSKLDAIEASATADQTGAQIKTAYEAESDTNAFTDALLSKLNAVEASADVTDATNVNAAGALMHTDVPDSDTGFLKRTGSETYDVDTATYLTANQSISISGDVTGSGTTSISATLANSGVSAASYGSASAVPVLAIDAKGRITSASTASISAGVSEGDVIALAIALG